ncbi:hypothetical protein [Cellulomonas sp.]|uniref:hypothetical protein n=1 Tax=Cellulomonas sp. TaxID=40001 RepID=UPI0028128755|nr:hypothetical protein [Cellulomonas sp.]
MTYEEAAVSYEEKGAWVYGLVALGAWLTYVLVLLARADGGPLVDVRYVPTLLWTVGISAFAPVVVRTLVEVVRPSDTRRADVRDREIDRRGEYVAGIVLGVGMVGPFALALADADTFWIAHAIWTVFVLAAVVGSVVKVVAYRRGL